MDFKSSGQSATLFTCSIYKKEREWKGDTVHVVFVLFVLTILTLSYLSQVINDMSDFNLLHLNFFKGNMCRISADLSQIPCDKIPFLSKTLGKYNFRYKAEVTFLKSLKVFTGYFVYRSQKTFTGKERCSLKELVNCILPPKLI